ncbi:MAG TPA: hypothetical protein VH054_27480, partial [Polyangiaceae bacterium]|nr:hypothetical protein [Polyangiaceae bacterium]
MKTFLFASCFVIGACAASNENAYVGSPSTTSSNAPTSKDDDMCLVNHFGGEYGPALRECSAACDASMKDSCKVLGDMYERGEGVTADASRADALHDKACRLGNTKA